QEAGRCSTLQYWIRRSILSQNLYGTEIMPEVVECCKLGLFLRMCEQSRTLSELALPPLLERHLRVGDALVGFATPGDLPSTKPPAISGQVESRAMRTSHSGVDWQHDEGGPGVGCTSWEPFHWWIEFREVMTRGGFDVIVGNPPYVADTPARDIPRRQFYETASCGNLCAYTLERALTLLRPGGRCG